MPNFRTAIHEDLSSANQRLADLGLTHSQIVAIRDAARAAFDDASPLMPVNAPGTLAYIYGVNALREQTLGSGWQIDRTFGIEAVVNPELGIRIGYQNVDRACDVEFEPMPRSSKGPASERLCNMPLFEHFGMNLETDQDRVPNVEALDIHSDQISTYFVMVGEDGSVELSSPIVSETRYAGFRERIFIDSPDYELEEVEYIGDVLDDFDVSVSLKSGM